MNGEIVLAVLMTGFGVSFVMAVAARAVAGHAWPQSQATAVQNFSPLPVLLAVVAGPSLFIEAFVREGRSGRLAPGGWALCAVIAMGWAACYGVLVIQCAAWAGLIAPGTSV